MDRKGPDKLSKRFALNPVAQFLSDSNASLTSYCFTRSLLETLNKAIALSWSAEKYLVANSTLFGSDISLIQDPSFVHDSVSYTHLRAHETLR